MLIATNIPVEGGQYLAAAMREALLGLARAYSIGMKVVPVPPLYDSGVRYQREPNSGEGWEEWADPWSVSSRGWGDCDDLVMYRVAELLAAGEAAGINVIWDGYRYHVRVRRADQSIEDPSHLLGG